MRSAARGRDPEGRTDAAPPLPRRVPHDRGAPGAKSFVDDLILGQGFVRSRAAPSLRSIENQPSTQAFVSEAADGGQHSPPLKGKATLPPRRLSSSSSSFASSLRWGGGGGRGKRARPRGGCSLAFQKSSFRQRGGWHLSGVPPPAAAVGEPAFASPPPPRGRVSPLRCGATALGWKGDRRRVPFRLLALVSG